MYKKIINTLLILCISVCAIAKKSKQDFKILHSTVRNADNTVRKNGDVYTFVLVCNSTCSIDSILFKNRPVPCDVYNYRTKQKISTCNTKDTIMVTAAKAYYKNMGDTTNKITAGIFIGAAKIYYTVNDKRKYFIIKKVERVYSERKMR